MKAAAIYARVSTEEQVKNTSLKGQLDAWQGARGRAGLHGNQKSLLKTSQEPG